MQNSGEGSGFSIKSTHLWSSQKMKFFTARVCHAGPMLCRMTIGPPAKIGIESKWYRRFRIQRYHVSRLRKLRPASLGRLRHVSQPTGWRNLTFRGRRTSWSRRRQLSIWPIRTGAMRSWELKLRSTLQGRALMASMREVLWTQAFAKSTRPPG